MEVAQQLSRHGTRSSNATHPGQSGDESQGKKANPRTQSNPVAGFGAILGVGAMNFHMLNALERKPQSALANAVRLNPVTARLWGSLLAAGVGAFGLLVTQHDLAKGLDSVGVEESTAGRIASAGALAAGFGAFAHISSGGGGFVPALGMGVVGAVLGSQIAN